jgi:hypothetical protein
VIVVFLSCVNGRIINGVERPSRHKFVAQAEREMEEENNPQKIK